MSVHALNAVISASASSQEAIALAKRVAPTSASVLITGESGTGKEVIAQKIHSLSGRKGFVAVNCSAIPEDMFEAMMFGYEKGAFTGALQALPGKFEQADKGTIFLDEISEISLKLQAKLLRVLQEKEVERLGSTETKKLDFRIVAASNQDLPQAIKNKTFREDLYHRLNMVNINLEPLRSREMDILPLARQFAGTTPFTEEAYQALLGHKWPGNVRELKNTVERAKILMTGPKITPNDLGLTMPKITCAIDLSSSAVALCDLPDDGLDLKSHVVSIEATLIRQALSRCGGSPGGAAKQLGLKRTTLIQKMHRYGIDTSK